MFLDPEPRRQSTKEKAGNTSPFFASHSPITSPRDSKTRRRPLKDLSTNQTETAATAQPSEYDPDSKPTVRLVRTSPSIASIASLTSPDTASGSDGENGRRKGRSTRIAERVAKFDQVKPTSAARPGSQAVFKASRVSPASPPTNEPRNLDNAPSTFLLPSPTPSTSTHAEVNAAWHRRSTSSGNHSNSSTLKGSEVADSSYIRRGSRRSQRLSEGTTLRGSVTPHEQDIRDRLRVVDESDSASLEGPAQALQTLQETSPERSIEEPVEVPVDQPTIKAVPPSLKSSSSDLQRLLRPQTSEASLTRRHSLPSASDSERDNDVDLPRSRRTASIGSLPPASAFPLVSHTTVRRIEPPQTPRHQRSDESLAQSEASFSPATSSPNLVAFYSDSSRPRSRSHPLHNAASFESIDSRLEYPLLNRPDTGRSLFTSSSIASLRPSSSTDTLAPIQIPKRRLHRTTQSIPSSLAFASGSMDPEDIDNLPYPRQQFSSYLSTIASESERSNSRQLSNFSVGSGVLTGDDASSIPLSGTWPRSRGDSIPLELAESRSRSTSPPAVLPSSEEEVGDMTLGIFRAESAKPEPLFRERQASPGTRKYEGPLPPLPPVPSSRDSDENFDTLSELTTPGLHKSRSGYSLRQRSNSTPSQSHSRQQSQISYVDEERWSHGSSIFPTWAKHFYGGTAALMSASKVSLTAPSIPRQREGAQNGQRHLRTNSQWTDRSITSRLGTGYSEIETGSPASSHFLPSIFRPRTRQRANTDGKNRRSKRSRPSDEDDSSRPDSLAIFSNPYPPSRDEDTTLPSGQPKWGTLGDGNDDDNDDPTRQALPRKYSKQRHWNDMTFPRPMSKDRLSEFVLDTQPHLAPTKRQNRTTLGAWRPPSFVESLDTLIKSQNNRQILFFALGFLCPLFWMLGACLPLPPRPSQAHSQSHMELEKTMAGSEEDVSEALRRHEAGDAAARYAEETRWLKGAWWRSLNRVMSVVGVLVIGAIIALAVVATR